MSKNRALVISGDGINCESETIWGLQAAGFQGDEVHITSLLSKPSLLNDYALIVFPGGFSFGDEIASGKVLAIKIMDKLQDAMHQCIEKDRLVLGICNGFQALVQMSLLPDSQNGAEKTVSLVHNEGGHFINKWVELEVPAPARTGFFAGLEKIELPIRHGEGRIRPKSGKEEYIDRHATLRYANDVNGSFRRIASLSNARGNVMGLMPHPEAFVRFTQHPAWNAMKIRMLEDAKSASHLDESSAESDEALAGKKLPDG